MLKTISMLFVYPIIIEMPSITSPIARIAFPVRDFNLFLSLLLALEIAYATAPAVSPTDTPVAIDPAFMLFTPFNWFCKKLCTILFFSPLFTLFKEIFSIKY